MITSEKDIKLQFHKDTGIDLLVHKAEGVVTMPSEFYEYLIDKILGNEKDENITPIYTDG